MYEVRETLFNPSETVKAMLEDRGFDIPPIHERKTLANERIAYAAAVRQRVFGEYALKNVRPDPPAHLDAEGVQQWFFEQAATHHWLSYTDYISRFYYKFALNDEIGPDGQPASSYRVLEVARVIFTRHEGEAKSIKKEQVQRFFGTLESQTGDILTAWPQLAGIYQARGYPTSYKATVGLFITDLHMSSDALSTEWGTKVSLIEMNLNELRMIQHFTFDDMIDPIDNIYNASEFQVIPKEKEREELAKMATERRQLTHMKVNEDTMCKWLGLARGRIVFVIKKESLPSMVRNIGSWHVTV